jgi:hypothetical protein
MRSSSAGPARRRISVVNRLIVFAHPEPSSSHGRVRSGNPQTSQTFEAAAVDFSRRRAVPPSRT